MLSLFLGLLAGTSLLFGQFDVAQITGVVRDSSQNVKPNAPVVSLHRNTGREFRTNSRENGSWALSNVPEGAYDITIQVAGFKFVRPQVAVNPANARTVDAQSR